MFNHYKDFSTVKAEILIQHPVSPLLLFHNIVKKIALDVETIIQRFEEVCAECGWMHKNPDLQPFY